MVRHLAVLAVALLVLVKSADLLVEYGARLARRLGVSDLVVGLVITSVGTSLPELASSLAAALTGSPGLVIGTVAGSNIANIGLVLGFAAVVRPLETERKMHDRDGFMVVATAALFLVLALDNRVGRLDAAVFVVLYVAYTAFVVRSDREGVEHRFKDFLEFVFDFEYAVPVARRLTRRRSQTGNAESRREPRGFGRDLAVITVSVAVLVAGARYVVVEAVWLAGVLQVPENLVGLSLVAVGTSLPELAVAVTAARRGSAEMVVGNVLGSNIANVLLILGVAALGRPLDVAEMSVVYTIPVMLFFSIGLLYFIRSDWQIGRGQGSLALIAYLSFLVAAFIQGWG